MIEFRNPHYVRPPGSATQILAHPFNNSESIELSVFHEHRYAFFYWNRWRRETSEPPCLVSLDWHQDLCFPDSTEKNWLRDLHTNDDGEVAIFTWAKLAGNNDGQILCAAYLNLIGNIYVHCRQGKQANDWKDEEIIDFKGNKHQIRKFKTIEELEDSLMDSNERSTFFDIDLDFFTIDNPYNGVGKEFSYLSQSEIKNILKVDRPFIKWIFNRIKGITIATEPEHCGGLMMSNRLMEQINEIYFEPGLFTPFPKTCQWRHEA